MLLILKSIFLINLFNSFQNINDIKSKIYFNPELFLYMEDSMSLTLTSISIFFLFLIFKKLKINF